MCNTCRATNTLFFLLTSHKEATNCIVHGVVCACVRAHPEATPMIVTNSSAILRQQPRQARCSQKACPVHTQLPRSLSRSRHELDVLGPASGCACKTAQASALVIHSCIRMFYSLATSRPSNSAEQAKRLIRYMQKCQASLESAETPFTTNIAAATMAQWPSL